MKKPLGISLLSLVTLLSGCTWSGTSPVADRKQQEATLDTLPSAVLPAQDEDIARKSLDEIHQLYKDALASDQQPLARYQLQRRLGALEMMRGERRLFDGDPSDELFTETVRVYEELLVGELEPQARDQLLYQLAKAHALGGDNDKSIGTLSQLSQEHVDSGFFVEAEFRRAENFFSAGLYPQAAISYRNVVDGGISTPYYHNALYMLGWALFKQNHYRQATDAFLATLDAFPHSRVDGFEALERGEKELIKDCYRILGVTFSYREGAASIDEVEGGLNQRGYLPDLYDALARLYLSQERYQDSATTYKAFTEKYPQADQSHEFFVRAIDMVQKAGFIEAVLEEKQQYTERFAIGSDYWLRHPPQVKEKIAGHLQEFIPQLAKYYHARAQQFQTALSGKPVKNVKALSKKQRVDIREKMLADFARAATFYQQYIDSFPEDKKRPEFQFLLAEALHDSDNFADAIYHYEQVAYDFPAPAFDNSHAMEAGYAAILAYGELIGRAAEDTSAADTWRRKQVGSEIRYTETFPDDKRIPEIILHAADSLVALKDDKAAIEVAEKLFTTDMPLQLEQKRSAWLLVAQASFRLEDYPYAEVAFQQAIATLPEQGSVPAQDKYRAEWTELMAASIYRQGELALAAGDVLQASEQYLRVLEVAPAAKIRLTAQYDAAEQLMVLEQWQRAIELLQDFERRYPNHTLSAAIPAKLVLAYENSQEWGEAADRIMRMYADEKNIEQQAELLFLAASYYEKDGDQPQAIVHYRQYAHTYTQFFDTRMEAMNKMDELYQQTGEPEKRRFWLRKIITADSKAGKARTERSRYLAAFASAVLADDAYQYFSQVKLTLPIKTSFKKKKQAMDAVVKAYTKTNQYDVEIFSTLAVYRLGEIYAQLSRDLMDSERPANLDALALEQYELLLEEQAFPFEEKAIEIHEGNARRSWQGSYDDSVKKSFKALSELLPGRYRKEEQTVPLHEVIY